MTKDLTIKDSNAFYKPILEIFRDGKEHNNKEVMEYIKERLPDDEVLDPRWVTYPLLHFRQAGCLEFVQKGVNRITADGIKLLNKNLDSLDRKVLRLHCPKYKNKDIGDVDEEIYSEEDEMESDITFEKALGIVKNVLQETGTVVEGDYDMLLVKKLPAADIILSNKEGRGKTTHIALTGEKMDIFPFLESFDYFYNEKGRYNTNSKVRFLLEVPVYLYASNLNYLDINDDLTNFGKEKILTSVTVVRNRKNDENWTLEKFKKQVNQLDNDEYKRRIKLLGYDVQAELSSNYSGEEFIDFRKLLYENYFLIILKHKKEFRYDIFAVLPEDGDDLLPIDYELYVIPQKTVTLISSDSWSTGENLSEESQHKLWSRDIAPNEEIVKGAENVLLYGVPGVGKSHTIEDEYCDDESKMERVVFHPDYTYSDFVGQILPKVDGKNVTYEFTEGPFTSILIKACANPNQDFYLIIEEINRGNAPAIFGDIFQLLDRKNVGDDDFPVGTSEYAITNSDIALKVYDDEDRKIRIPSNLNIIATMNTADQNVFTLDTAFQRRWHMRLIPNKFKNDHEFAEDRILESNVTWKKFVNSINELILDKNTLTTSSEDKRLGVYFVKKEDLEESNADKFAEKVLKYLWDDAFKFSRDKVFIEKCKSLEDVIDEFIDKRGNERFNIFIDKEFILSYGDSDE